MCEASVFYKQKHSYLNLNSPGFAEIELQVMLKCDEALHQFLVLCGVSLCEDNMYVNIVITFILGKKKTKLHYYESGETRTQTAVFLVDGGKRWQSSNSSFIYFIFIDGFLFKLQIHSN